jgi:hypothetical protein
LKPSGAFSDGRSAAAHVLKSAKAPKPIVIFMTGEFVDANGCADGSVFLQKPFRILDVLAIMREAFVTARQGSSN